MDGGPYFAGHVIFNRAHQHSGAGSGIQQRLHEEGCGGLAVCAGDAGSLELAFGMAEEGRRSLGQRTPAVFHFKDRQAGLKDQQMVELRRRIGDDTQRARGDGLLHVTIAVGRAAFHGDKHRAGPHAARVIFDAGHG